MMQLEVIPVIFCLAVVTFSQGTPSPTESFYTVHILAILLLCCDVPFFETSVRTTEKCE